MLPTLTARDIEEGLKSYVSKEFPLATRTFMPGGRSVIDRFLDKPESLIKGPWLEISLPFRRAAENEAMPFTDFDPRKAAPDRFPPYVHQLKAFRRLAWQSAKSTLIATGTGSGKTECFLYPVIDYCLANPKKGIKALIIYPMNALASDQEKRLAELLAIIKKQGGKREITAGLYTGDSIEKQTTMGEDHLITDRYALRDNPPDILLTNYKMLDFLLMRPEDQPLWEGNGPDILRYLVVDELHTFDGAQGTDLACLIRRLRDRLKLDETLACVGTSATIGKDVDALRSYASQVFAASFDESSVIGEDRLAPEEFLASCGEYVPEGGWPDDSFANLGDVRKLPSYMASVVSAWFGEPLGFDGFEITDQNRLDLSKALPMLEGFRRLITDLRGVRRVEEVADLWLHDPTIDIPNLPRDDETQARHFIASLIDSLAAMVSEARVKTSAGKLIPFLNVRTQLWIRELARSVVSVSRHPELKLAADLPGLEKPLWLPLVGCRECNRAAWAAYVPGGVNGSNVRVRPNLKIFYESWFKGGPHTELFYPIADKEELKALIRGDEARSGAYKRLGQLYVLCSDCGRISQDSGSTPEKIFNTVCDKCGSQNTVVVWIPNLRAQKKTGDTVRMKTVNRCPYCQATGALRIFGGSNAALTASALSHLNASPFSEDHKVIAFSDSVQDAAQRAGFITARNYLSVVRHALVHYLVKSAAAGGTVSLPTVIASLPAFWLRLFERHYAKDRRKVILAQAEFLATFMPQDREWTESWSIFEKAAHGKLRQNDHDDDGKPVSVVVDVDPREALCETFKAWEGLYDTVRERLVWEVLVELGYRALKGRSVTRIGAATLSTVKDRTRAVRLLTELLKEHLGIDAPEETVRFFLNGVLEAMRTLGAFDVSNFQQLGLPRVAHDFGGFLKNQEDWVAFNSPKTVLPRYGQLNNPPNSVTIERSPKAKFNNAVVHSKGMPLTWFEQWARRLFAGGVTTDGEKAHFELWDDSVVSDIYKHTFEALQTERFVNRIERSDKTPSWVLEPKQWQVTTSCRRWKCSCCGRVYAGAQKDESLWTNSPCHSPGCLGHLELLAMTAEETDERQIFVADPVRINAREHTGLIDGDTRAEIESSFSSSNDAWSVNLLSATPTLEMGIDIGCLSTVIQCSMPPKVANYKQRIGRAGRRDGNALAITLANRDSHGQYFWEAPEEMLKGEVTPPGVFLRAVSVLERQFLAFSITRWVSGTEPLPSFKKTLGDTLTALNGKRKPDFPTKYLAYTAEHGDALLADFFAFFAAGADTELSAEAEDALKAFVKGNAAAGRMSLSQRVLAAFERRRVQFVAITNDLKALENARKRLEKEPESEKRNNSLTEIDQQIAATSEMKSAVKSVPVFQFLTDEGLLPNYAFPEEGVTVDSVILKRRDVKNAEGENKGRYIPYKFTFSRGASAALSELVPNSYFYVNAHKLHIDQVRLKGNDSVEAWRFCRDCAYAEPERTQNAAQGISAGACPKCGSEFFAETGQVRNVLRMRELIAHADARLDVIDDSTDSRQSVLSTRALFITSDEPPVRAWQLESDRLSFGFEFLRSAAFRELNFGERPAGLAESFTVNGSEMPATGYKICTECGMVYKNDGNGIQHDISCPYRDKPAATPEEEKKRWHEGLFLFREMKSEAVRIRVPVAAAIDAPGATRGSESLMAAVRLGLRKHFKGSVDHLTVTMQTEPAAESDFNRIHYIVIYDTIPGGSGYLKDLMRFDEHTGEPEQMKQMLREAYDAVAHCSCASDPEKDGCYRCVYGAHDAANRANISRREAEGILREILPSLEKKLVVVGNVREIPENPGNVLEAKFVEYLKRCSNLTVTFNPAKDGKTAYDLTVQVAETDRYDWKRLTGHDVGETFTWRLLTQQDVKRDVDGFYASRPDFTIRPAQASLAESHPELTSQIFTDGWEPHRKNLDDDARKRQSLINIGQRVWTFTWKDIAELNKEDKKADKQPGFCRFLLSTVEARQKKAKTGWTVFFGGAADKKQADAVCETAKSLIGEQASPLELLIQWLVNPSATAENHAQSLQLAAITQVNPKYKPAAQDCIRPLSLFEVQNPESKKFWFQVQETDNAGVRLPEIQWCASAVPGQTAVLDAALRVDEEPYKFDAAKKDAALQQSWRAYWQCANVMQFADHFWCCTLGNETDACYEPDKIGGAQKKQAVDENSALQWKELRRYYSDFPPEYAPYDEIIRRLAAENIPYCDEFADGVVETIAKADGMLWNREGKSVWLFAGATLLKGAVIPQQADTTVVIAMQGDDKWIDELKAALQ